MSIGLLSDSDRFEVVRYRLEKAIRTYHEAVGAISNGYSETASNRLYYAAYYAVSALLIAYKYEASTHNGVIQMFGKAFIKTNIIDREYGKIFNQLFSLRMTGDYEDRHILILTIFKFLLFFLLLSQFLPNFATPIVVYTSAI